MRVQKTSGKANCETEYLHVARKASHVTGPPKSKTLLKQLQWQQHAGQAGSALVRCRGIRVGSLSGSGWGPRSWQPLSASPRVAARKQPRPQPPWATPSRGPEPTSGWEAQDKVKGPPHPCGGPCGWGGGAQQQDPCLGGSSESAQRGDLRLFLPRRTSVLRLWWPTGMALKP